MSVSEWRSKSKELEHLAPKGIITLTSNLGGIAQDHYNLNDFVGAEVWFRRTILVKGKITWYKPEQTLWPAFEYLTVCSGKTDTEKYSIFT
jgi:hypothetical protein